MVQLAKTNLPYQKWIPQKERKWVYLSIAAAAVLIFFGIWIYIHNTSGTFHTRSFKSSFQNYGSLARILLVFVLAHYALMFLMKKKLLDNWSILKKFTVILSRILRKWHTPIAVITISLILLHAIGAILYGITLTFSNITGLLALAALLPVPVSGLLRYKRLDKKWHLRSGLAFALLFIIHAFL